MPNPRLSSSRKFLIGLLSLVLPFYVIISLLSDAFSATQQIDSSPAESSLSVKSRNRSLVPLEAHIMSKCPDARDCLQDLVVPAMEQVVDKVDFTLSFIGSVDSNDSVHCKHGATECLGNMLALCAINLYPHDPVIYLGFSNCLISTYSKIPSRELVEPCALEHGIPFEDLNACVSEEGKGLDLLTDSIERSEAAGVKRSCTVRVDNQIWCVRDGGQWKDCPGGSEVNNLVKEVERLYEQ
ncbi:MAG: hypothetical protein LQ352_002399 [Teloschistes flavicans]|nr:MAG: hypothetical protein LQ352_002399 [Teloschistes flavicans]